MRKFSILLLLVLCTTVAYAQQNVLLKKLPNDSTVIKGKLENGLTYYIKHNAKPAGRAEFYLATNVGAIQERPDQDGLAHFLEHMCFNGTKNFPDKGIINYLQSIGASFGGNINANTGVEETVYMLTNIPIIRKSVIDTCLLIIHDYSHFVTNDPKEIDKERPVILDEKRQRNTAAYRMYEKSAKYLFGDTKYAKCTVIGTEKQLKTFKPKSLTDFYHTWYVPNNQAVIVVGDVNPQYVEAQIKKIFSSIPAAKNPAKKEVINIPDNKKVEIGIISDPEATSYSLSVLWKNKPESDSIRNTYLGEFSNLVKYLVSAVSNERLSDIASKPNAAFLSAAFGFDKICRSCEVRDLSCNFKEGNAIKAFKRAMICIKRIQKFGFTQEELDRAKSNLLNALENEVKSASSRENSSFVNEYTSNFFFNSAYMTPKQSYNIDKNLLSSITLEMLNKQVLPHIISDTNMIILYNGVEKKGVKNPTKEEIQQALNEVDSMKITPLKTNALGKTLLDSTKIKAGKILKSAKSIYGSTTWTLSNGLKVVLLSNHLEKNKVLIELIKDGGLSHVATKDLASMNNKVFNTFLGNSGISKFSPTDLTKMLSGKTVAVSPFIDYLNCGISGNCSTDDIKTAFQLIYLYITDPRFNPDEFKLTISSLKSMYDNIQNQPGYKFIKHFMPLAYGDNPRFKLLNDSIIKAASLKCIEKNYKMLFNSVNGATLYIVGDFSIDKVKGLVEKYFASLPGTKENSKLVDNNIFYRSGIHCNDFKTKMQTPQTSVVDIYSAKIKYNRLNVTALTAAKYILSMRYVNSLREEIGGTYGANVSASFHREPYNYANLSVEYQCEPAKTDTLQKVALQELKDLAAKGPSEEEFKMAVENLQKSWQEYRIKNSYWLNNLNSYVKYNEDNDKLFESSIKKLTKKDVQSILQDILKAKNHIELIMRPE